MRVFIAVFLLAAPVAFAAEPEHDPGDGGRALDAFLNFPESVAVDHRGNLYIAERGGNRVRRVDAKSEIITTIAADLNQPTGLVVDNAGNVIIGDTFNYRILRVDAKSGVISTIAGTGEAGFSGDGGPATKAQITAPFGLLLDADQNLYFTDTEVHRIRRVDRRTGVITTVAGNGVWAYGGDGGPAIAASLARPHRIVFDRDGDLIIGDSFNQRIRRVDMRSGTITTIAGTGLRGSSGDGGPAKEATFCYFGDLLFDARGDLLVSGVCDNRIRKIDMRSGIITAYAGDGGTEFGGEGKPFLQASFSTPVGMARGKDGIYLADMRSHRVRLLNQRSGKVITVAGGKVPRNPVITWRFIYKKDEFVREQAVPIPFRVTGMEAVRVQQDLRYADDALRRFDLYRPPGGAKLPLVILVSGRNDTEVVPDTWGVFESRARVLAASGFGVVMFNHRLGLNGSIVQVAEDLDLLLDALDRRSAELNVDASNIAIVTYSMGSTALPELLRKHGAPVRGIVAFYPYADLRELANWQAPGKTAENAERYSMVTSFREGVATPRMLLIRAGKDSAPLLKGVDGFVAAALSRNDPVEVINHPAGATGFDREASDREVARIMQRVVDFLREVTSG